MSQQLAGPAMPLGPDRSEYFEALVTADASGEATSRRARPARGHPRTLAGRPRAPARRHRGRAGQAPAPPGARAPAGRGRLRGRAGSAGRRPGPPHRCADQPRARAGQRTSPPAGQLVERRAGGLGGRPDRRPGRRRTSCRPGWPRPRRPPRAGSDHPGVPVPGGDKAPALAAPLTAVLGWLAHVSAEEEASDLGASVRWMAEHGRVGRRAGGAGPHGPAAELPGPEPQRIREGAGQRAGRGGGPVDPRPSSTPSGSARSSSGLPGVVTALEGHPEPKASPAAC